MSGYEAFQLQNRVYIVSCYLVSSIPGNGSDLRHTIERDMPGPGAAVIRDMPMHFPDTICRFH